MVTILMAVYNGERYLKGQLDSLKNQTYGKWRLIVRDDGSSDRSVQILKEFAASTSNEVLIYSNDPPAGSARNNFARLINDALDTDYIMFADQDDVWKRNKIKISMDKMKKLEAKYGKDIPLLVHGDLEVVNSNMKVIASSMAKYSDIRRKSSLMQLLVQNNVTGCTMLINKALCNGIAKAAGSPDIIMHDYLAAIYAKIFGKTAFINKPLVSYRQHGRNSIGAKANKNPLYLIKRLLRGRADYKAAMQRSQKQAAFFLKTYGRQMRRHMSSGFEEFALYSRLYRIPRYGRIRFYFATKAWKKGAVRKIMQFLWG